jgi:hypothetical protein
MSRLLGSIRGWVDLTSRPPRYEPALATTPHFDIFQEQVDTSPTWSNVEILHFNVPVGCGCRINCPRGESTPIPTGYQRSVTLATLTALLSQVAQNRQALNCSGKRS